ncbi:MAG: RsmB/NOP family class I SAM-dependent RNA methyltransferase [Paenibacillus sp.]|uniref:RsmB/NOP family class I SAM-dependent RNA methyltransferase n=2 Tax=Paenibacillus TaxID=44249 RepID=UPI0029018433|nr:RsmB/NOP family class I SAM-dependent RNA methyltransferase [Paenibacillus sp.]MDU2241806.1 RsmB/NOP family class I SAM-dependent RNA methyltransferase [Paenibacillus sp.]
MTIPSLPSAYLEAVAAVLGPAETEAFLASYAAPRTYGLRLNTLKIDPASPAADKLAELFALHPVPWCGTGYYYEESTRPGKHPYHAAGLYYIQEPSAMSAVELLDPQPGHTVLDLAAAPGGKTTQIAGKMAGQGLLISNEIHPQRARILAENVERLGIRNAVVTQAAPPALSGRFPLAFDRIMLDAPCSGEGMFRKDPEAIREWSPEAVELCAARQWDILQDAVAMLKPGGRLAYSTCTFNRRENEDTIVRLLAAYPFLRLIAEKRIWPHREQGEGHYVALIERDNEEKNGAIATGSDGRTGAAAGTDGAVRRGGRERERGRGGRSGPAERSVAAAWDSFRAWSADELPAFAPPAGGTPLLFGEALYLLPASGGLALTPEHLTGLKVPRAGLHLGDVRKGRFEPAHALAMALGAAEAAPRVWTLGEDSPLAAAYLRGETLEVPASLRGWHLVTLACGDGQYPLGWGKASGGQLKNHLPKGLRH